MNSGDGSNPSDPQSPHRPRQRLELGGDASHIRNADRVSTVVVHADDPTPPPGSIHGGARRPAQPSPPFPSQAMPSVSGRYQAIVDDEDPTPPAGTLLRPNPTARNQGVAPPVQHGTGRHQAVPPQQFGTGRNQAVAPQQFGTGRNQAVAPQQFGTGRNQAVPPQQFGTGRNQAVQPPFGTGQHASVPPRSAHDAEHITNTGFIPTESFRPAIDAARKRQLGQGKKGGPEISLGKANFTLPKLTFLDDTDTFRRVQYAGGGFLGGAFTGLVLGIINAVLQGWNIVDGLGQIAALAILLGVLFSIIFAMRPERVDDLLSQVSFLRDSDSDSKFDADNK